jgi:hypothetical protein
VRGYQFQHHDRDNDRDDAVAKASAQSLPIIVLRSFHSYHKGISQRGER